jgi:hypothetical protein
MLQEEVPERIKSPTFLTLFNNTISVVFTNYKKLHTLIFMVTSPTVITVVKQWVQLRMGPTVTQIQLLLSYNNGLVTMVPKFNP